MSALVEPYPELPPQRRSLHWYAIWWKAITRPTVGNYEYLLTEPHTGFRRVLLWILLAGIGAGLLSNAIYPGFVHVDPATGTSQVYFAAQFDVILLGWLVFAVYLLLQHGVSHLMGGNGRLSQLAFLSAAYTAPLILFSAVLSGLSTLSLSSGTERPAAQIGVHPYAAVLPDSPGWFFGRNAFLTLLLFGFSFVAVRAAYQLKPARAFLAALSPALLAACVVSGMTVAMWWNNAVAQMPSNDEPPPKEAIYVMDADGSHVTRLTDGTASDVSPVWSRNGHIAFTSDRSGNIDIYVMNADGSGLTRLTTDPARDVLPSWSLDGNRIVFTSYRSGDGDIYVMNADGTGQTRLTDDPAEDMEPAWSPDGKWIAFTSVRNDNHEIFVMKPDGTQQTRLTFDFAADMAPAWYPDGQHILFDSTRGDVDVCAGNCGEMNFYASNIFVMDWDGKNVRAITNEEVNNWFPSCSPDGMKIAFISNREGNDEIYVMDADGSNRVNLTHNAAVDSLPTWSPDGKQIVFSSQRP